jgi:DNA-directed RNA polymerase specialized sigma24 family protein
MSPNDQSTPLELNLQGYTARQYAALILKEDLGYSHERAGLRLNISRYAFATLYKRAKSKPDTRYAYRNILLLQEKT